MWKSTKLKNWGFFYLIDWKITRAIFKRLLGSEVMCVDFFSDCVGVGAGLKLSEEESSMLNRVSDVKELRSWEDPTV